MKMWKVYRQTDRQTDDGNRWSEKLTWAFSSGELKIKNYIPACPNKPVKFWLSTNIDPTNENYSTTASSNRIPDFLYFAKYTRINYWRKSIP